MTDGQTFFLLLFIFYVSTSFKADRKHAFIIRKKITTGWSLGHPLTFFSGANKSLCFTHISPLKVYSIIVNLDNKSSKKILSPRQTKRIVKTIAHTASRLRLLTVLVFYSYFIILPITYLKFGDTPKTYIVIAIAICFPFISSLYFFMIHKKIAPLDKITRWKQALCAAIMPWQAMRLADYLFDNPHLKKIHPLSLASIAESKSSVKFLSQQYRNSIYLKKSLFKPEEFLTFFSRSSYSPSMFTSPPEPQDSTEKKYCPCCHTLYTDKTNRCTECNNISLTNF